MSSRSTDSTGSPLLRPTGFKVMSGTALGDNPEVPLVARSVLRLSDRQGSIFEFQLARQGRGPVTGTSGVILERGGEKILLEKK